VAKLLVALGRIAAASCELSLSTAGKSGHAQVLPIPKVPFFLRDPNLHLTNMVPWASESTLARTQSDKETDRPHSDAA